MISRVLCCSAIVLALVAAVSGASLKSHVDVCVLGAGPAGIGATRAAIKKGLSTVLFDSQSRALSTSQ